MCFVFDSLLTSSIDLIVCLVVRSLFDLLAGALLPLMFCNCEDPTPFEGVAEKACHNASPNNINIGTCFRSTCNT